MREIQIFYLIKVCRQQILEVYFTVVELGNCVINLLMQWPSCSVVMHVFSG